MVSAWNKFVQKTYNDFGENKGKPGYKFKDALKKAAPLWKKQGSKSDDASASAAPMKTTKRSKKSRSRRTRRTRRRGRN